MSMPSGSSPVALSTMWAVQPRFERDFPAFVGHAAALGYQAVEINHSMDAAQSGAILTSGVLPVTGVHAPAPLERHPARGWNRDLNLAATDEEERRLAVAATQRSVDLAAEAGARYVVVHLGGTGRRLLDGERRLRTLYQREEAGGEAWQHAIADARRERAALVPPHLEAARRSLDEIARHAERRGIAVGLECRLHYHEIPSPQECAALLAAYPPSVAGYLHDVGHAEVQHRLGLTPLDAWEGLLRDRLVGVHIHDVRGITDHRAPGTGDVDFRSLAARISPGAARTLEIDQREPDAALARALDVLYEAGVLGSP